jgi:hypothetical protein
VDHGGGDIEVGARAGDDFVALKGLKTGERIATSANFLIDSESQLQAALGSFAPPPAGVGAATAMNATQGATLEYSSNPSTPRTGSKNFRVKLTGADGAAITGAQVTVTFFMPAMPAMGMAAMRMRAHNSYFNATYNLKARIRVQLRASPPRRGVNRAPRRRHRFGDGAGRLDCGGNCRARRRPMRPS